MITVKAYNANEGDAFLLSFGKEQDINILIDMGLKATYEDYIKSDLIDLNSKGKKIDLLIITHIDKDHINGALAFIEENGKEQQIIKISNVWHNSFRHLQFDKEKISNISIEEVQVLKDLINRNSISDRQDGIHEVTTKEGTTFASSLLEYSYNWNYPFENKAVSSDANLEWDFPIKIIILSPNKNKLKLLAKKWERELQDIIYNFNISDEVIFDDAFEFYMQNKKEVEESLISDISINSEVIDIKELSLDNEEIDRSETNGSSIAFILEYMDKKLLFLADSHEDIIYSTLSTLKKNGYSLNFELVKISHHGSKKNISKRVLDLIESKRFLISTDGKRHNHPSPTTIAKIITSEGKFGKEIIFNNDMPKLDFLLNKENKEKYNFTTSYCNHITII